VTTTRRRFWNYPRPGYRGLHRWLPSWRFTMLSVVTVICLVVGVGFAAYYTAEIPPANASIRAQTTSVYFADPARSTTPGAKGAKMGDLPGVRREIVDCSTLPKYIGEAIVSSEDQSFYSNSGVDPRGIVRALVNNLSGGARQGGSTLTQQYVKNYFSGNYSTYMGKVKQMILALKIDQEQSKDEILCNYMNTIFWGRGQTYGIQAAAQAYFGKDAKDLDVAQAALLAGIIPSPNNWDPADNPDKAKQRWDRVLNIMVSQHYLKASEQATLQFPQVQPYTPESVYGGPNGYIMKMAEAEAAQKIGMPVDQLMRSGYSIITTIDQSMQNQAVQSAQDLIDGKLSVDGKLDGNGTATPSTCLPDQGPDCQGILRIGMVSIEPSTGAIRSLYSGQDFFADQINRVTRDAIQAGSTFKPFTLIAALESGISLNTTFSGASPMKIPGVDNNGQPWTVQNFGNASYGTMDLVKATALSVNTVYAQLNMAITHDQNGKAIDGPTATIDAAERAGITTLSPADAVPSNVLGTAVVHPLDMASAYGVLADEGSCVGSNGQCSGPHIVAQIIGPNGEDVYTADTRSTRVFDSGVVADTVTAMQGPVNDPGGSAHQYVAPLKRHIAGKTGTSTDNRSAWFVGFTPDIVTAVAMSQEGANSSQVSITPWGRGVSEVTGGTWPANLWADYMRPVLAMAPYSQNTPFPPRANVGSAPEPTETATQTPEPEPTPTQTAPATVTVPAGLVGATEDAATQRLMAAGLTPNVVSDYSDTVVPGRVIRSDPGSGQDVPAGSAVTLVVSSGPQAAPPLVPPGPLPGGGGGGGAGGGGGGAGGGG